MDAQKVQPNTDAGAHLRSVFADPAAKDECIEAAEPGREAADPFLRLVAEEVDRVGGTKIAGAAGKQIAHVRAGFRNAEQPRMTIDHVVKLLGAHVFGARDVPDEAGIEVSRA